MMTQYRIKGYDGGFYIQYQHRDLPFFWRYTWSDVITDHYFDFACTTKFSTKELAEKRLGYIKECDSLGIGYVAGNPWYCKDFVERHIN